MPRFRREQMAMERSVFPYGTVCYQRLPLDEMHTFPGFLPFISSMMDCCIFSFSFSETFPFSHSFPWPGGFPFSWGIFPRRGISERSSGDELLRTLFSLLGKSFKALSDDLGWLFLGSPITDKWPALCRENEAVSLALFELLFRES